MSEHSDAGGSDVATEFSEREFYLREFRGHTLAIAAPAAELRAPEPLVGVRDALVANGTRVIVISTQRNALEPVVGDAVLSAASPGLEGAVWRRLRAGRVAGLTVAGSLAFAPACRELALRLRPAKLIWIDRDGGLRRGDERVSFLHLDELRQLRAERGDRGRQAALLREVEALIDGGVPAVNLCTLAGLADELFTYTGSGTLFTRERYVVVRPLTLDDYDAAADLIRRGEREGYLAPRSPDEQDRVLASALGAFVEDRHLAGIGALLCEPGADVGELASLYTLTRFVGEGVGAHLVAAALERARERGLARVFACTTSPRVGSFFQRLGFAPVPGEALPGAKWRGYDPARRARLRCYMFELTGV